MYGMGPMFNAGYANTYGSSPNYGYSGVPPEQVGWNLNSAYMTPSFMAGYRPDYQGSQNFPMPYMGFGRGMYNATFGNSPWYINPTDFYSHSVDSASRAAMDAPMSAVQILGASAVSAAVASAMASRTMAGMFNPAFGAAGRAAGAGMGYAAGGAASLASRALGFGPLSGAAGVGSSVGSAIGGAAGWAGSIATRYFVAPYLAYQAADKALFAPYMGMRQTADSIQENLRGTLTGYGTARNPLGVSMYNANAMGANVARSFGGMNEFAPKAGAEILTYGMQAGLYKNINSFNSSTVTQRTKEIAQQVKVIMDVFNEPSMQEAIKMIGDLSLTGGASIGGKMSKLVSGYQSASAITGTATKQLMNTIGVQGQMMYGQSGVLPYLGQSAALTAYSGITQAWKSGLVSTQALSMLGGVEGATQSALQSKLGLAQTQYNRMLAYSGNVLGMGDRGNVTGNIALFGAYAARDPLTAMGSMILNGDKAVSAQMSKDPSAVYKQLFQVLDYIPGSKRNGKYTMEAIASQMQSMGFSQDQIESAALEMKSMQNPEFRRKSREAARAGQTRDIASELEKQGLYGGVFGSLPYAGKSILAGIQEKMVDVYEPMTAGGARVSEAVDTLLGMTGHRDRVEEMSVKDKMGFIYGRVKAAKAGGKNETLAFMGGLMDSVYLNDNVAKYRNNVELAQRDPKLKKEIDSAMAKVASGGKLSATELDGIASKMGVSVDEARETIITMTKTPDLMAKASNPPGASEVIKGARKDLDEVLAETDKGYSGWILDDDMENIRNNLKNKVSDTEFAQMASIATKEDIYGTNSNGASKLQMYLEKDPNAKKLLSKVLTTEQMDRIMSGDKSELSKAEHLLSRFQATAAGSVKMTSLADAASSTGELSMDKLSSGISQNISRISGAMRDKDLGELADIGADAAVGLFRKVLGGQQENATAIALGETADKVDTSGMADFAESQSEAAESLKQATGAFGTHVAAFKRAVEQLSQSAVKLSEG